MPWFPWSRNGVSQNHGPPQLRSWWNGETSHQLQHPTCTLQTFQIPTRTLQTFQIPNQKWSHHAIILPAMSMSRSGMFWARSARFRETSSEDCPTRFGSFHPVMFQASHELIRELPAMSPTTSSSQVERIPTPTFPVFSFRSRNSFPNNGDGETSLISHLSATLESSTDHERLLMIWKVCYFGTKNSFLGLADCSEIH